MCTESFQVLEFTVNVSVCALGVTGVCNVYQWCRDFSVSDVSRFDHLYTSKTDQNIV
jgi:hypothetical protein